MKTKTNEFTIKCKHFEHKVIKAQSKSRQFLDFDFDFDFDDLLRPKKLICLKP